MMVKVCGITNQDDANAAEQAGADALGFNFYPKSPRYITPAIAAQIRTKGLRVGVFVDEPPATVAAIAQEAALDVVQLHGTECVADYMPLRVWKAFRVTFDLRVDNRSLPLPYGRGSVESTRFGAACVSERSVTPGDAEGAEAVLLDGPAPGTGESFDWSKISSTTSRLILAGGLGPDNVADAIRRVRPWGVDACSRIESAPGRKDHDKMRQFIEAAHMVSL